LAADRSTGISCGAAGIPLIRYAPVLLAAGCAAALVHHFALRHLADRYRPAVDAVAACRPETILYNSFASRVALSTDARSFYLLQDQPSDARADVAVVSLRQVTNRFETSNTYRIPAWLLARSKRCSRHGEFYVFDLAGQCPAIGEPCIVPP
jgi:hypothetical protein